MSKTDTALSERQLAMFMYFNLQKQAFEWMSGLIGMTNKELKYRFNNAHLANKKLIEEIEKDLLSHGPEFLEQFWNDSEYFSRLLKTIKDSPTDKKQELLILVREYLDGKVTVIES